MSSFRLVRWENALRALVGFGICAGTGLGCTTRPSVCDGSLVGPSLRAEQLRSIDYALYAGAPAPMAPGVEELAALAPRLASSDPAAVDVLRACYGEEQDLLAYATRDTDGDGIHDYRVSDGFGKFHEGDLDIDGDGVVNVLDSTPYDPRGVSEDSNGNGVPDAVDWGLLDRDDRRRAEEARAAEWVSLFGGPPPRFAPRFARSRVQKALVADHEVLVVDRSARFDEGLALALQDVIGRIFRLPLKGETGLRALSVVASEEVAFLTKEVDDGTHGVFVPQSRSLTIYRAGLDADPFVQLGLLTHELGHAYQYSLDFADGDPHRQNLRVYHPAPSFYAEVAPFGWSAEPVALEDVPAPPQLYTDHYYGVEPSYLYRGRTPAAWAEWLDALYDEQGDDYLADERVVAAGIVGDYSLQNPWEWYSDNLLAYVFMELEGAVVASDYPPEVREALLAWMRARSRETWPGYRYQNVALEVRERMRSRFPIAREDLEYLVEFYVVLPAARFVDVWGPW